MEIIEREFFEIKHKINKEDVLNRLLHNQNIKKYICLTKLRNVNLNLEINFVKIEENKTFNYESKVKNVGNNFKFSKYMFLAELLDGLVKKRQYHFVTILKIWINHLKNENNFEKKNEIKTFYNIEEKKNIIRYKIEEEEQQNINGDYFKTELENNFRNIISNKDEENTIEINKFQNENINPFIIEEEDINRNKFEIHHNITNYFEIKSKNNLRNVISNTGEIKNSNVSEMKNKIENNISNKFENKIRNINKKKRFSQVLYLLSQKYQKNIDERFLNEQIKHFVLKNKIKNKNILNLVSDNNIEIKEDEFNKLNQINKREKLLNLYMAIEMFYPLDLIFFKKKQTYNRHFFKRIFKFIKIKEFEKKVLFLKKIFFKIEEKFLIPKELSFNELKYHNSLLKRSEKFFNFLNFHFKLKKSLIYHFAYENIKKMNKNKWIFVVLHNIFYRTKLFNFMVLKLNLRNVSKVKHSLNIEYSVLNSAILKSMNQNFSKREKCYSLKKNLSIPELFSNGSNKKQKNLKNNNSLIIIKQIKTENNSLNNEIIYKKKLENSKCNEKEIFIRKKENLKKNKVILKEVDEKKINIFDKKKQKIQDLKIVKNNFETKKIDTNKNLKKIHKKVNKKQENNEKKIWNNIVTNKMINNFPKKMNKLNLKKEEEKINFLKKNFFNKLKEKMNKKIDSVIQSSVEVFGKFENFESSSLNESETNDLYIIEKNFHLENNSESKKKFNAKNNINLKSKNFQKYFKPENIKIVTDNKFKNLTKNKMNKMEEYSFDNKKMNIRNILESNILIENEFSENNIKNDDYLFDEKKEKKSKKNLKKILESEVLVECEELSKKKKQLNDFYSQKYFSFETRKSGKRLKSLKKVKNKKRDFKIPIKKLSILILNKKKENLEYIKNIINAQKKKFTNQNKNEKQILNINEAKNEEKYKNKQINIKKLKKNCLNINTNKINIQKKKNNYHSNINNIGNQRKNSNYNLNIKKQNHNFKKIDIKIKNQNFLIRNKEIKKGLKNLMAIFKRKIKKNTKKVFYILSLYLEIIEVLEVIDMSNILEPQIFSSNLNLVNSRMENSYMSPIMKKSNIGISNFQKNNVNNSNYGRNNDNFSNYIKTDSNNYNSFGNNMDNSNVLRNNVSNSNYIRNNINTSNVLRNNINRSNLIKSNLNLNNSNFGYINKSHYFNPESQIHRYENILKSNLQKITTIADLNQSEINKSQYLKSTSCFKNIKNTKNNLNKINTTCLKRQKYNMNKKTNNDISQILTSFVINSKSNPKFKNSNSTKKIIKKNLFKDEYNSVSPSISSLLISEHRFS